MLCLRSIREIFDKWLMCSYRGSSELVCWGLLKLKTGIRIPINQPVSEMFEALFLLIQMEPSISYEMIEMSINVRDYCYSNPRKVITRVDKVEIVGKPIQSRKFGCSRIFLFGLPYIRPKYTHTRI